MKTRTLLATMLFVMALLVDDAQMLSLSSQEYTTYMKTAKASTDATKTAQVKRVGQNLANVSLVQAMTILSL